MILQSLIAFAERENLGDADFETVAVRWLIPLDKTGNFAHRLHWTGRMWPVDR
jgi:hypothetical protein